MAQENYEESLEKCQQINRVIPNVCTNIRQIKRIHKKFEEDAELQRAEQWLSTLESMQCGQEDGAKAEFVDQYRKNLITGLQNLAKFFEHTENLQMLNDKEREEVAKIAANIAQSQDSIVHIAGH